MKTAWKSVALVLALCLLASCAAWLKRPKSYFAGDLIKVPHEFHKSQLVDCSYCHDAIWKSTSLEGTVRPPEATCLDCHADEKEKGNCGKCHTDVKQAGPYPQRERTLKIDHKAHLVRVKDDCSQCHAVLPSPVRTAQYTPPMKSCLNCHEHERQFDEGRCEVCHTDLKRYPLKPVSLYSHQGNWVKIHGASARSSVEACGKCHEQTFCSDCHAATVSTRIEIKYSEKVDSDFIHRDDWVSRHSLEARADQSLCRRCHGSSFCVDCHTAQNLSVTAANPRNPHPPGWAFPGSPDNHAPAARSDIASCAACHDQGPQSNCIKCHKVGGVGGNPHPSGWTNRHPHEQIRTNGMCTYCH